MIDNGCVKFFTGVLDDDDKDDNDGGLWGTDK